MTVVGAINWDISIFEQRFPRPGEEVPVRLVEEFSGGKGANVAVAAARVLGRDRVAFLGALGDDEVSGMQMSVLREEGVITRGVAILRGRRSGRAYVVVNGDGRKTIHTHFGANDEVSPAMMKFGEGGRLLSRSRMVVVMDSPVGAAVAAARRAREAGSMVIYSPGVRTRDGIGALDGVLRLSNILVLDTNEVMNLWGGSDELKVASDLARLYPALTVVATLGPRGCLVVGQGNGGNRVEGVDLASIGKKAVNSTGSGDAFLGVFASYLLLGRGMMESVKLANLAGALKATRYETRGSPRRKELETRAKSLGLLRKQRQGSLSNTAA